MKTSVHCGMIGVAGVNQLMRSPLRPQPGAPAGPKALSHANCTVSAGKRRQFISQAHDSILSDKNTQKRCPTSSPPRRERQRQSPRTNNSENRVDCQVCSADFVSQSTLTYLAPARQCQDEIESSLGKDYTPSAKEYDVSLNKKRKQNPSE